MTDLAVLPSVSQEAREAARRDLAELLAPAPMSLVTARLAQLRALTAHRSRSEIDLELVATAYAERLGQYPADVVAAACDAWANREEWWPSWAELKAECDKRMRGRLRLARALGVR